MLQITWSTLENSSSTQHHQIYFLVDEISIFKPENRLQLLLLMSVSPLLPPHNMQIFTEYILVLSIPLFEKNRIQLLKSGSGDKQASRDHHRPSTLHTQTQVINWWVLFWD